MRIVVFGASGRTGRAVISQGLAAGHDMVGFARHPETLAPQAHLTLAAGDVQDTASVAQVIVGAGAVISALGNKFSLALLLHADTSLSTGTQHIIAGMRASGVRRLLWIASFGASDEVFWPEKVFLRTVLHNVFADLPAQEQLICDSGLDWTIVRPARLTNGPLTERYQVSDRLVIGPWSAISRADVADFLIAHVTAIDTIHKTLTLSN